MPVIQFDTLQPDAFPKLRLHGCHFLVCGRTNPMVHVQEDGRLVMEGLLVTDRGIPRKDLLLWLARREFPRTVRAIRLARDPRTALSLALTIASAATLNRARK